MGQVERIDRKNNNDLIIVQTEKIKKINEHINCLIKQACWSVENSIIMPLFDEHISAYKAAKVAAVIDLTRLKEGDI